VLIVGLQSSRTSPDHQDDNGEEEAELQYRELWSSFTLMYAILEVGRACGSGDLQDFIRRHISMFTYLLPENPAEVVAQLSFNQIYSFFSPKSSLGSDGMNL
jgi:hypothetical protein